MMTWFHEPVHRRSFCLTNNVNFRGFTTLRYHEWQCAFISMGLTYPRDDMIVPFSNETGRWNLVLCSMIFEASHTSWMLRILCSLNPFYTFDITCFTKLICTKMCVQNCLKLKYPRLVEIHRLDQRCTLLTYCPSITKPGQLCYVVCM